MNPIASAQPAYRSFLRSCRLSWRPAESNTRAGMSVALWRTSQISDDFDITI